MARNLDSEPKSEIEINTKSIAGPDNHTFYTRLDLPKDPIPKTLRAYWASPIHKAQIELIGRILRG